MSREALSCNITPVLPHSQVPPLNERLREQRGCKLLLDVVQTAAGAPELRRVLQFVCGNTLVCETIEEARMLAFGPERLKVISEYTLTHIYMRADTHIFTYRQTYTGTHTLHIWTNTPRDNQSSGSHFELITRQSLFWFMVFTFCVYVAIVSMWFQHVELNDLFR